MCWSNQVEKSGSDSGGKGWQAGKRCSKIKQAQRGGSTTDRCIMNRRKVRSRYSSSGSAALNLRDTRVLFTDCSMSACSCEGR